MPKIPKWLGDTMETVFSAMMHKAIVEDITFLDDKLINVRFAGDFQKIKFVPGNVVEFRINETEYRHYTPAFFDSEKGICDILFYLHGKGPGSMWASTLKKANRINLIGPGGKLSYNPQSKYHLFFGDETSLSVFTCLKEIINENDQNYLCILELEDEHRHWPELTGLSADVVSKSPDDPAREAILYLDGLQDLWDDATFYLTGNAKSIQAFRKALIARHIKSSQIRTEPYWADGKTGL